MKILTEWRLYDPYPIQDNRVIWLIYDIHRIDDALATIAIQPAIGEVFAELHMDNLPHLTNRQYRAIKGYKPWYEDGLLYRTETKSPLEEVKGEVVGVLVKHFGYVMPNEKQRLLL